MRPMVAYAFTADSLPRAVRPGARAILKVSVLLAFHAGGKPSSKYFNFRLKVWRLKHRFIII
jgi:hypothetical protein